MQHTTHTLPNGLRLLHLATTRPVVWTGVAIDAGTRDEYDDESGMAHFVEHMLFKGTTRRRSYHIISRLESVGGQLDAYTTKEETYVYATVPAQYTERALELLADITLNSTFPDREIERERDVVLDEIQSYNDSPSELIYDEFEQLLYPADSIGRNILGTEQSLATFNSQSMRRYVGRTYAPQRMVLFYMGPDKPDHFFRRAEKHFGTATPRPDIVRQTPKPYTAGIRSINRDTYQAHCIIGSRCCSISADERLTTVLLNNILGGPSMVSRLNLAIRERNGLCYNIESNTNFYTDTGVWNIYFGCDPRNLSRAKKLCMQQLALLCDKPLTPAQLRQAKTQLRGQVLIANENLENQVLAISKAFLHRLPLHSDEEQLAKVETISAADIQQLANTLFAPQQLSIIEYREQQ